MCFRRADSWLIQAARTTQNKTSRNRWVALFLETKTYRMYAIGTKEKRDQHESLCSGWNGEENYQRDSLRLWLERIRNTWL